MQETVKEKQLRMANRILVILLIMMTFAMGYAHAQYQQAEKECQLIQTSP